MNYLQNKYNILSPPLENLAVLVKLPRETKTLQLLYHSLITKPSIPPFKFFKQLKKHITLLTYLLPCPATRVLITSSRVEALLDIWHGLQQSEVDSAIDGERVFAPVYGP